MAHRKLWIKILLTVFLLSPALLVKAQHDGGSEEQFNPGTFILEHIGDAYEWHILTFNGHHVSIPLPVILYSEQSGFHMFLSTKFHHGGHDGFSIAADGPHKGKIVEQAADGPFVRPMLDLSITRNVFAIFVSMAIILWVFILVAKTYKNRGNRAPKGLQSWVEPVVLFVRDDIARPAIGHKCERFMPYLLTLFFFILVNNLMGLIPFFPFGANVTGNITVTLVLAVLTFLITTFSSTKTYWLHIFNTPGVPWWLKIPLPLMPFTELLGVITKPFVLMIRLFANITAGHIIAIGFFSLIFIFGEMNVAMGYGVSIVSILFTVFMTMLELLVAFIQAYVFTLLSALYFGMAIEEGH
jgi:F-type H+-transporting ATPase subunit a